MRVAGALTILLSAGALAMACGLETGGIGPAPADDEDGAPPSPSACDACSDGAPVPMTVEDGFDKQNQLDDKTADGVVIGAGTVSLASMIDLGTSQDGDCVIAQSGLKKRFDLTAASCVGRNAPDIDVNRLAKAAKTGDTELTLARTMPLDANDELMLLIASGSDAPLIGRREFVRVQKVAMATVTLAAPLTQDFDAAERIVLVVRVPNYRTLRSDVPIVATGWTGALGGVLALRVHDALTLTEAIDLTGLGYQGGARPPGNGASQNGFQGEGFKGGGGRDTSQNFGGGGAGQGDTASCEGQGQPGAGGGHADVGKPGAHSCATNPGGQVFGDETRLTYGGGGGSGGNDNATTTSPAGGAGGAGGGALYLAAGSIKLQGPDGIIADGTPGQGDAIRCSSTSSSTVSCWDFSGPGGGGAGGTIYIGARAIDLSASKIVARGGVGGLAINAQHDGGNGAPGRIVFAAADVVGSSDPAPKRAAFFRTQATVTSVDLLAGRAPARSFESIAFDVPKRPATTKVQVQVSTDGTTWVSPSTNELQEGTTVIPLTGVVTASAHFFYRLTLTGDGFTSPEVDRMTLTYSQ